MPNRVKKTALTSARIFILTGVLFTLMQALNKAYAEVGFDNPNQVCQDTANLQLVQNAIAVIATKFPVTLRQPCQWHITTAPGIVEPAMWYFANYTSNGLFKQGSAFFNAVLDLKYACERSAGKWGPIVLPNESGGGHSYVACEYYPKR